jgi:23S rRNA (adenine2503-C2)-methyltransferase
LRFGLNEPEVIQTSEDGTQKFLFRLKDGLAVESVLIPQENHLTLCISTQVGCAQGCAFCLTARMGFKRNLTSGEIINQVLAIRSRLDSSQNLTNVVLMGMGEPLANYEQTLKALRILMGEEGVKFGRRRVTLSTVGLVPMIRKLGDDLKVSLAVSLNAVDNTTRSRLMPVNRRYPLEELLKACREFPLPPGRRITFEYVLIKDINDSPDQAEKLAVLLHGIKAKINLIPFNEYPDCAFKSPSIEAVELFREKLIKHHYTAIIRKSKGRDILAACGQLAGHKTA